MRLLILMTLLSAGAANALTPALPPPIEVMLLGTFHLGNPGRDIANAKVDSVLTPAKQAQLAEVAARLAAFAPTVIAVERVAADPATMLDQKYPAFTPADLLTTPDERVQIGFRIANRLKLTRVYAIDEQNEDREPDYFPFDAVQKWAAANGQAPALDALFAPAKTTAAALERDQKTQDFVTLLAGVNDPDSEYINRSMSSGYYGMLRMGSGRTLPGADLNGRWYTRNAKIFAKLLQVAKPGDRVLVVYGAGHSYWLRHFVQTMPGYKLADVVAALKTPVLK